MRGVLAGVQMADQRECAGEKQKRHTDAEIFRAEEPRDQDSAQGQKAMLANIAEPQRPSRVTETARRHSPIVLSAAPCSGSHRA